MMTDLGMLEETDIQINKQGQRKNDFYGFSDATEKEVARKSIASTRHKETSFNGSIIGMPVFC